MDSTNAFLIGAAEEGSHCIVMLLLTGRATPYLHNGVVYVGDEDHYVSASIIPLAAPVGPPLLRGLNNDDVLRFLGPAAVRRPGQNGSGTLVGRGFFRRGRVPKTGFPSQDAVASGLGGALLVAVRSHLQYQPRTAEELPRGTQVSVICNRHCSSSPAVNCPGIYLQ